MIALHRIAQSIHSIKSNRYRDTLVYDTYDSIDIYVVYYLYKIHCYSEKIQ